MHLFLQSQNYIFHRGIFTVLCTPSFFERMFYSVLLCLTACISPTTLYAEKKEICSFYLDLISFYSFCQVALFILKTEYSLYNAHATCTHNSFERVFYFVTACEFAPTSCMLKIEIYSFYLDLIIEVRLFQMKSYPFCQVGLLI